MKVIFVCLTLFVVVCSGSVFEVEGDASIFVGEDLKDDAIIVDPNGE